MMMSPQDVLQAGQRSIAPRTGISPRVEGGRSTRDERRRATHNEGITAILIVFGKMTPLYVQIITVCI